MLDGWRKARRRAAILCIGWLLCWPAIGRATGDSAGAARAEISADRLIFLLDYVGTDYAGAVRDGKVVNPSEYGEVLRFVGELRAGYGARNPGFDAIAGELAKLDQLIKSRAASEQVRATTDRLLPELARRLGATAHPNEPPNIGEGGRLWASDCTPCHGPTGAGDGLSSSDMQPPPTAFRGERLERLSPRRVYGALTFGIDGTAMPSFADAYTDRQLWDLAFFVPTLRVDFDPKRPAAPTQVSLDELAASSNVELLDRLRRTSPNATASEVDFLRVNLPATKTRTTLTPTAAAPEVRAADPVAVALELQDVFAGIADRVRPRVVGISSYVRDDSPSPSPSAGPARRGEQWLAQDADAARYPGFRVVRTGSGFFADDEGTILTCDHLVRDERGELVAFVDVELADQTHLVAAVAGAEPTLDLAILQLAEPGRLPKDSPPLELGDSDHLQVGHWLVALGDPPGPEKVFAVGVVSSPPERQCYQEHLSATLLQSSLVVPPLGLGGPVVDIRGHLIGMTIRRGGMGGGATSDAGSNVGILPINLILNLRQALIVARSSRSPWLGISVLELPLLRGRLGEKANGVTFPKSGIAIDDVFDPSPASRAGVRPGDFLVGLGGHEIASVADFQKWLYVLGIGAQVQLDLLRDGTPLRVSAPIELRPPEATTR